MFRIISSGLEAVHASELKGFEFVEIEWDSLDQLCDSIKKQSADAILFGMAKPMSGAAMGNIRANGVTLPVLHIARGPRSKVWSLAAAHFLDCGGDDIIEGPAHPEEISARLRAVIRRAQPGTPPLRFSIGGPVIEVDLEKNRIRVNGEIISTLTAYEHQVLVTLAKRRGVVSRATLWEELYETSYRGDASNTIEVFTARVRKKLGDAGHMVDTVRGQGYALRGRLEAR